jgi:hypothetical protein
VRSQPARAWVVRRTRIRLGVPAAAGWAGGLAGHAAGAPSIGRLVACHCAVLPSAAAATALASSRGATPRRSSAIIEEMMAQMMALLRRGCSTLTGLAGS